VTSPVPASSIRPPDLVNPVTGDRLWFIQVPRSAGDPLVIECELPPKSPGTPLHIHTSITERFECMYGALSMIAGDPSKPVALARGEHVDVPIGTRHRFWNATDQPVCFRGTVTPGVEFEKFLRSVYALGVAGRVGPDGMPRNLLQLAILRELSDLYFVGPPLLIQRPVFGVLSLLATLTGTRKRFDQYSSILSTPARRPS
jgi:mannose-6-phosphate isomerase-like protein (cupin superfamily)